MTLTELRYVVTLARERHFGRAAERCHVSQPTLSVAVKKLEDELGIPLFERSKSSIRVTETGQRIIEQAQRVLDQVGVIKDMAQDGKNQLNSPLKVGAIYTIGPYLFPHLLPELRRAAPEMPLYIEENYTANLRQKLRHSDLDAIIIALPFEEPEVVTMPLYDEPFVVLLPADHPLTAKDEITADELSREQLLLLGPGHCFRDQVLESCPPLVDAITKRADGDKPDLVTEGSSLETIRHMVASGLGITVLPLSAATGMKYHEDILAVRPFAAPVPFRTVALAWRVTFPRPKAIDVLSLAASQCRVIEKAKTETPAVAKGA
ncbi:MULTISPECIES: hydrogen peroxide-inducible genes activator [Marinobacter]|jgi:LysR family hydrogen peroxide-inducible transcriptional activator|uniref:Hydrogen peroxide-inducible genes activator n=1 Tax=Marinobacter vinifirmus TaxID=355591 RepID=A0A259W001_9GAMM|nr:MULTISPECIES: hydrogen peroxide-inducible genes activator [Marinobacter]HBM50699.1 hydrogen peroxide-inducible genes activator [Marinobacter sp.]ERP93218.1 LysR family transcriptional regulator [Marinobacter sp. ES-1]KRW83820.1 LysR family transcriptional regulator [Marinobacter sp. P4B1]OZC35921.1 LysR family transcriptional regulator [Marinobacter vinifirmus]TVT31582.1 MAG: hydrogen peroxide-inducible genes activator [Marinobacter vinifirmus]|tara:strand:- start:431 stop:1390 length:960 start_codon:yes stop_codon:yes gene_type:complete